MSTHSTRLAQLERHVSHKAFRPGLLATVSASLGAMMRARQTRRLLAQMDDRTLSDIGIGRGDAMTEASRPMWDVGIRR